MSKKIILSIILLASMTLTACSGGNDNSSSNQDNISQAAESTEPTEPTEIIPISPEAEEIASDGGLWEAINIEEGVEEYNGVSARVFNQWIFSADGNCLFYINGSAAEQDTFVFDEGSTTDFTVYVYGDENGQQLKFSYDGEHIYWLGDGFTMTFEKVQEFTTVSSEELRAAYGQ